MIFFPLIDGKPFEILCPVCSNGEHSLFQPAANHFRKGKQSAIHGIGLYRVLVLKLKVSVLISEVKMLDWCIDK